MFSLCSFLLSKNRILKVSSQTFQKSYILCYYLKLFNIILLWRQSEYRYDHFNWKPLPPLKDITVMRTQKDSTVVANLSTVASVYVSYRLVGNSCFCWQTTCSGLIDFIIRLYLIIRVSVNKRKCFHTSFRKQCLFYIQWVENPWRLKQISSCKDTLAKNTSKVNNMKKNQFSEKILSLSVNVPRAESNFRANSLGKISGQKRC